MAVTNCNLTPQREKIIGDSYYCGVYEGWREIFIIIRRQESPNGAGRRFAYRWCVMDYDFEKCWANLETVEFKDRTPFRLDLKNLLFQSEASTITLNYEAGIGDTTQPTGTGDNAQTMALLGQISAKLPTTNNSLNVHGQVEVTNHSTDYAREETLQDLLAAFQQVAQELGRPIVLAPNQPTLQVELVNAPEKIEFPDVQKVQVINPTEVQRVEVSFPEVQKVALDFPETQKVQVAFPDVQKVQVAFPDVQKVSLPFPDVQKTAPQLPSSFPVSNAALGAPEDATATTDTAAASLVALIKRLLAKMPFLSLGQKPTTGSLAVVLASDQPALPITGNVGITGTVPVSGSVSLSGTPTVVLAPNTTVGVSGNVGLVGTPTVALATNTTVSLTGTPTVSLAAGTSVAVTGTVGLTGSPTVTLAAGSTVGVGGTVVAKPFADASQDFNFASATNLVSLVPMVVAVAPGAGLRNYLTGIQFLNTATLVASELQVKSGTTLLWRGYAPTAMATTDKILFETPLRGELNQPITLTALTVGLALFVNAQGYKAA